MRHRLTALFVALVLLPSMPLAGRSDCVMGDHKPAMTAHHETHRTDAHAPANVVSGETNDHEPAGHAPAPAQCAAVLTCGVAVAVETMPLDALSHSTNSVAADAALAPDSPARGIEPPPPRG